MNSPLYCRTGLFILDPFTVFEIVQNVTIFYQPVNICKCLLIITRGEDTPNLCFKKRIYRVAKNGFNRSVISKRVRFSTLHVYFEDE